jgi:AcrR family transcriptional regulator
MVSTAGLDSLSLRRLAGSLGVTAPALYAHVTDKRDLIRALAEEELGRMSARFDAVDEPDPLARIRAYGRAYVDHAQENPELFKVIFLFPPDLGSGEASADAELPAATATFNAAAEAVAEASEVGAIDAPDPLLAALTLWSGMHGVVSVLQLGFELPPSLEQSLVDNITDRILKGYGAVFD